jgi:hypothetical protein
MAATSVKGAASSCALSSEARGYDREARLLRSVRERHCERKVFLLDFVTALTLDRLTLALRTAETKPNEDPEDECLWPIFRRGDRYCEACVPSLSLYIRAERRLALLCNVLIHFLKRCLGSDLETTVMSTSVSGWSREKGGNSNVVSSPAGRESLGAPGVVDPSRWSISSSSSRARSFRSGGRTMSNGEGRSRILEAAQLAWRELLE